MSLALPIAGLDRMDADAKGIKVIHGSEHPDPALIDGLDTNTVSAPHFVRAVRGNRSVVAVRYALGAPMRRQQSVLAHQTQYPGAGDSYAARDAQPRPDLAVTLTDEGRGVQVGPDCEQEVGIREIWLWAAPHRMQGK
jgi:hypothetical protein